ncbi:MAG: alpha-1,2-fucosyltransferase [Phocaeicola dorei]|nr:alpha-1,2-fucosyltransferase [Phocaeicola dorei]
MNIVVFKGGLGNQLFQYVFYKYLSKKKRVSYFYDNARYNTSHNCFELDRYFEVSDLRKCNPVWIILFKFILSKLYHRKLYIAGSVEYRYPSRLFQLGYFLDKKFYDEKAVNFKHLPLSEKNESLLNNIQNSNSVGIHIRRGDYMTEQNFQIFGNICTPQYYYNAVRIIREKVNDAIFYVFSDDIDWVQTHLDIPNAVYINWNTGESSIYDMYLMSFCKYNIIANSTFSYWAARLNKKANIVIYPSKWYNTFTPDIFPKSWCGI